ncbi:MAG: hypothetical protein ACXVP0_03110 [Bacteroidia bacterium]
MSRICYLTGLAFLPLFSFAQSYEARIGVSQGLNAVMIGASPGSWHPGQSTALAGTFNLKPKQSPIYCCASLAYMYHSFSSNVNKFLLLSYPQSSWHLSLQMALALKNHLSLRAGLFVQHGVPDNKYKLFLTDKSGTGTYSNGFSDLSDGYKPSPLQAGILAGVTIGLGEKEIVAIDIQLQQYLSPITGADYSLMLPFSPGSRQLLISVHARPTVLLAGLSFKINTKRGKRNPEESRWKPWMV